MGFQFLPQCESFVRVDDRFVGCGWLVIAAGGEKMAALRLAVRREGENAIHIQCPAAVHI